MSSRKFLRSVDITLPDTHSLLLHSSTVSKLTTATEQLKEHPISKHDYEYQMPETGLTYKIAIYEKIDLKWCKYR